MLQTITFHICIQALLSSTDSFQDSQWMPETGYILFFHICAYLSYIWFIRTKGWFMSGVRPTLLPPHIRGNAASKGSRLPWTGCGGEWHREWALQLASRQWARSHGAFTVSYQFGKIEAQWGKSPLTPNQKQNDYTSSLSSGLSEVPSLKGTNKCVCDEGTEPLKKTGPETLSTWRIVRLPFSTKRSGKMLRPRQPGNGKECKEQIIVPKWKEWKHDLKVSIYFLIIS